MRRFDLHFTLCFWKVKSDALSDQLIAFTRGLDETFPIQYCDLPSAALNQTCAFQLLSSNRDRWPLDAQHFGEEFLRNQQYVVIAAVMAASTSALSALKSWARLTIALGRRIVPQPHALGCEQGHYLT